MRKFALLWAVVLSACNRDSGYAYSATVRTESVAVGSQVGGRIAEVDVAAGQRIARGAAVLRLDPSLLAAQAEQMEAQTRQAAQRLAELEHGNVPSEIARARAQSLQAAAQYRQAIAQIEPQTRAQRAAIRDAQAALRDAQAQLNLTRVTYERQRVLEASGDVSHQSLDQARAAYAQDRAHVTQARARLAQARQNYANLVAAQLPGQAAATRANAAAQSAAYQTVRNGTRAEQVAQARAELDAAMAAESYAKVRLDEAVVRAPADGVVASFDLHTGDLLNANQTAAIIDTFADPYVYIYPSQANLATFAPGRHVRIRSDAGGAEFDAVVESHDRTAQFTPVNTETADQRAELVYG
ncbi:MAG TPA: HlyD family efflux transporter periplasmic adaptor subunit, partial [Candidatus Baltobacteraceae bacterium]|nr:HlyD family efflux transporter periplasmic adaptor subunit [Candidatus Baltobacteraceae bacterium]